MRSFIAAVAALSIAAPALAAGSCVVRSGPVATPVVELYTSEGCSSCPPADKWASSLKPAAASGQVVVEAFHVGYWDALGWVDRFASPAYTARQRQLAAANRLPSVYTPQVVRNGRDWRDFSRPMPAAEPARAAIELRHGAEEQFTAEVTPVDAGAPWAAYWTVTEDSHSSKVRAGENAGEFLQHDFVVRQYAQAGTYRGASTLSLRTIAPTPGHDRRVNLVVFEPGSGRTLQALSSGC